VPDTLTSWVISGYAVHPEFGIGVQSEPIKLVTVRPFFITLNVPYAIVKGEVLTVQVLVHSYFSQVVQAEVRLENAKEQFKFLPEDDTNSTNNTSEKFQVNKVKAEPNQVTSTHFTIIPQVFGVIELEVKATTNLAGDFLVQPLIVKPPGRKQTVNQVAVLDLRGETTEANVTLRADFPSNRVDGADVVTVSAISDVLGPSISNLDNLLQLPSGSGEQNMANFVQDIVILDYLTKSKGLTPVIKKKAVQFLEAGYQKQLTYAHYDGSFSTFGKSDSIGSTWLTAFVLKSFQEAKPYISIDDELLTRGLKFLDKNFKPLVRS
jgi:CD109 antigen